MSPTVLVVSISIKMIFAWVRFQFVVHAISSRYSILHNDREDLHVVVRTEFILVYTLTVAV